MGIRFFKKASPDTAIVLSNNTTISFSTLDGLVGYFATDKDFVSGQFQQMIEEQRYGLSEISEQEFHQDYVELKKNGTQVKAKQFWQRESLGAGGYEKGTDPLSTLGAEKVRQRVAVVAAETAMESAPANAPVAPVAAVDDKAPPKPSVGTRKRKPTP